MPPRAVLFDFDGVIADTENIHVAAWQRTFGLMGWRYRPTSLRRAAEIDDRDFLAEVFAGKEIDGGDVDGWVRRKQELTVALLADSPRIYPGVAELVARLRGRVRLAVVSTTWRENIETVLRAAGPGRCLRGRGRQGGRRGSQARPRVLPPGPGPPPRPGGRGGRPGGFAHRPGRGPRRRPARSPSAIAVLPASGPANRPTCPTSPTPRPSHGHWDSERGFHRRERRDRREEDREEEKELK